MRDCYYDREKKSSRLSGGCAIVITTGKKVLVMIFLRENECIEFECNKFVLVLVTIDLIHLNIQFVLVQLELKLIQIH